MRSEAEFAARLRWWRHRRGWSQLELAGRAGISQRHLSFLEIGRATPSRDMVARLATTLDVPLRQHNELLVSAGFASVWHETEFAAPELARVRDALDFMLGWFKKRCREAGLDEVSAHGLRKLGEQSCAEAGATDHQLMALFGWANPQQAAVYTKKANRARLEASAAPLLEARRSNKSVPLFPAVSSGGN